MMEISILSLKDVSVLSSVKFNHNLCMSGLYQACLESYRVRLLAIYGNYVHCRLHTGTISSSFKRNI